MTEPSEASEAKRRPQQRKQVLLRLDPSVHEAIARWAGDELRSANAQIEFLLRRARGGGAASRRGRTAASSWPATHTTSMTEP